jgi:hypothetical protein
MKAHCFAVISRVTEEVSNCCIFKPLRGTQKPSNFSWLCGQKALSLELCYASFRLAVEQHDTVLPHLFLGLATGQLCSFD